jgi:hypothetical protein
MEDAQSSTRQKPEAIALANRFEIASRFELFGHKVAGKQQRGHFFHRTF